MQHPNLSHLESDPEVTSATRQDLDHQTIFDFKQQRPREVRQVFERLEQTLEAQWVLRSPRTGQLHAVASAFPSADGQSSLIVFEFPPGAGELGYGILIHRFASPDDLAAESDDVRALYDLVHGIGPARSMPRERTSGWARASDRD